MKNLCVIQHVEAEYLGLLEDHFESRSIRFQYCRPFVPGARLPGAAKGFDGLILLGAGPLGVVSGPLIPSMAAELRLAQDFLAKGLPIVGIGAGAILLAVATGGGAEEAPLQFRVAEAKRIDAGALDGHMPEHFPVGIFMRDRPVLPPSACVLARDGTDVPVVFTTGSRNLGFLGHPGIKSAMVEDLIMESAETPDDTAESLARLRAAQVGVAEALTSLAVGIVSVAGWMEKEGSATGPA